MQVGRGEGGLSAHPGAGSCKAPGQIVVMSALAGGDALRVAEQAERVLHKYKVKMQKAAEVRRDSH